VPVTIYAAVSSGRATYADLATILSLEDLYDILEIVEVESYNDRIIAAASRKMQE
jgi:hypothetical protein